MNMIEATLERQNGGIVARSRSQSVRISDEAVAARPGLRAYEGRKVILGIRPEDLEDRELAEARADDCLTGTVVLREALGSEVMVHFTMDATQAMTEDVKELARDIGDEQPAGEMPTGEATMIGRFGARSRTKEGAPVRVAVDTRALHFFDPATGLGIYDDAR